MSSHRLDHVVPPLAQAVRLDKHLADTLALFPRSQYDRRNVTVHLQGKALKPSARLQGGEVLAIVWDDLPEVSFGAEDVPLDVLYEDDKVVVVNKPQGMVVHPAHGNWTGTLVQGLLHRVQELADNFEDEGEPLRPGIVHRLDKDTSGVLIAAKTPAALEYLAAQFRERSTQKTYFAVVKGSPRGEGGRIEGWLGRDPANRQRFASLPDGQGKAAATEWRVLARSGGCSLVRFRPLTGRTHQLRVHSVVLGCPILGDPIYSRLDPRRPSGLMLHAAQLIIRLPGFEEPLTFRAPLPPQWLPVLSDLGLPAPPFDEKG